MKLYFHPISGHAHRARLFLSLIGADVEIVEVDLAKGEHKSPEYLAKNRFGQVPLLEDDGEFISDSNAIMVYAAKKFGRTDWLPADPIGGAKVQRWLSVAAGQIAFGPGAARLVTIFKAGFNPEEVIARAHTILALIEAELDGREWIAADTRRGARGLQHHDVRRGDAVARSARRAAKAARSTLVMWQLSDGEY